MVQASAQKPAQRPAQSPRYLTHNGPAPTVPHSHRTGVKARPRTCAAAAANGGSTPATHCSGSRPPSASVTGEFTNSAGR